MQWCSQYGTDGTTDPRTYKYTTVPNRANTRFWSMEESVNYIETKPVTEAFSKP